MKISYLPILILPFVSLNAAENKPVTEKPTPSVATKVKENELLKLFPEGLEGMTPENRKNAIRFTVEIINGFKSFETAPIEPPDVAIKKRLDALNQIIAPLKSGNAADQRAYAAALKVEEVFVYIVKEPVTPKPGVAEWPDKSLNKLLRMPSDPKKLQAASVAQGVSDLITDYAKMVLGKKHADTDFSKFKTLEETLERELKP